jgi:hypothetical protein
MSVEASAAWMVVPIDSVPVKARALVFDGVLKERDPLECVRKIEALHWEYSSRIEQWLRQAGVSPNEINRHGLPTPRATITSPKWAGLYCPKDHTCHYPVCYAMLAGLHDSEENSFRIVVAHEVTHHYQTLLTQKCSGHGPDFYAVMRLGAREPVSSHTHTYSVSDAKKLSRVMLQWWQQEQARGTLASLPMTVDTNPYRREGAIR